MATLDRAEALLEELRSASYGAAQKDLEEVTAFAAAQVGKSCESVGCAWVGLVVGVEVSGPCRRTWRRTWSDASLPASITHTLTPLFPMTPSLLLTHHTCPHCAFPTGLHRAPQVVGPFVLGRAPA